MSETMISKGYFGRLHTPVPSHDEDVQAWDIRNDALPEGWGLNYDGTMIFSNEERPAYDVDGLIFATPEAQEFRDQADALGYDVGQVKFYVSHWYNGCDSPMVNAGLEDVFL